MSFKSFTKKVFCCAMLAASVLTANAAIDVSRLMIVGGSVWCGYSIDNSIVLSNAENPNLYKATVYISNEGDGFKFLTYAGWGGELCPESNDIVMDSGVEYKLCVNDGPDNKFKVKEAANYDIVCDVENEKQSLHIRRNRLSTPAFGLSVMQLLADGLSLTVLP